MIKPGRDTIWRAAKIAVGSSVSILIANKLSLSFATSAGIITLLTIQNTKQATFRLVAARIISFVLSITSALFLKFIIPSESLGFGILLLLICILSLHTKWESTISVNAVFGTHVFMSANALTWRFEVNEISLLFLGISLAILLNLHMPDREQELQKDIKSIEHSLSVLLHSMSLHLLQISKLSDDRKHIDELIERIDKTLDKAFKNKENTLQSHSQYYIEYLRMRKAQCVELIHFYREITTLGEEELHAMPEQAMLLADFFSYASHCLDVKTDISQNRKKVADVMESLDSYPLPETHKDFKNRFILYHLMTGMEELLQLKQNFREKLTDEQKSIYLPD